MSVECNLNTYTQWDYNGLIRMRAYSNSAGKLWKTWLEQAEPLDQLALTNQMHLHMKAILTSGRSRISRRGGRGPVRGGMDLRCGHFSTKMYVKTKELGPIGGVCPARPSRSANVNCRSASF